MKCEKHPPLLAAAAGVYREGAATGRLARYFRCFWSHRLPADFCGRILIVPDGFSDLIWTGERLMVVGPDRTATLIELEAGAHVLGLRFRPGAALRWIDTPLSELVDKTVPLSHFWGKKAEEIEQRLLALPVSERFARLLVALEMHDVVDAPKDIQTLFAHLSNADGDGAGLRSLGREIGLGERTLRRRSLEHFGYGPKTLERILRFQVFLRGARNQHRDNFAAMALEAGYADQAHMNREVKSLSTLTPLEVLTQFS